MAKKKLREDSVQQAEEKATPIKRNDDLYNRPINPIPAEQPKIGVDVDQAFYDTLITAAQENKLDIAKLESFSQISQNRNQVYTLLDTMAEDSTIAAILETYVEDATEVGLNGHIIWAESLDPKIAKYVTYLLDTMNVDKHAYKWVHSLVKYGDLYLRLYRESDYNDKLFDSDDVEEQNKHAYSKRLNEDLAKILDQDLAEPEIRNYELTREESARLDDLDENVQSDGITNILNEDVKLKLYSQNDRYVHYLEMIPNPAEVYELTRLGKTYAYIQAPTNVSLYKQQDALMNASGRFQYSFKKKDVHLFEATEFVHAALEDNSNRQPEEVNIFLTEEDYENERSPLSYTVRRGQSLLYNSYKTWRELMLLEYSMLLNRVTKSSIIRVIGVEVGDMPKEQIGPHLQGIKALMEQKAAIDVGGGMSEYTNPGPIENNIYVPTHNGIGAISTQQIGGDVNVRDIADIDYFKNKFYGSLKVPKQYFGDTDDSAGFDGGTSLSIISSRYAKTIKRIQNTFIQAITDAVNLMLIDKGLTSYVNKFELHMVPPTTREELDRQDATSTKIQLASDVMMLVAEIKDLSSRLKVLKAMLADAISDSTVAEIIQEEIDRLEALKIAGYELDENGDPIITEDSTDLTGTIGGSDFDNDFGGDDFGGFDDFSSDSSGGSDFDNDMDLPSPADLGMDMTDSDSF